VGVALPYASADDLAEAAREWAARAVVHPVSGPDELAALFDAAGFDAAIDVRTIEGSVSRVASGPWSARSTEYAEIVATKR
jgi:hypothetical protein